VMVTFSPVSLTINSIRMIYAGSKSWQAWRAIGSKWEFCCTTATRPCRWGMASGPLRFPLFGSGEHLRLNERPIV